MKLLGNCPLEDRKGKWRAKFRQICIFIPIGKCKEYFFGKWEFTIAPIHSRQREMDGCSFRRSIEEKGSLKNRENDLQIMYHLVWYATNFDANREVHNGKGPVDFKFSKGSIDSSLVEFKLASNSLIREVAL